MPTLSVGLTIFIMRTVYFIAFVLRLWNSRVLQTLIFFKNVKGDSSHEPILSFTKRKPYFLGYFARQQSRRTTGIYFGANVIFSLYLKRPLGITRPYLPYFDDTAIF